MMDSKNKEFILRYKALYQRAEFARSIRAAVYGLWSGKANFVFFVDNMQRAIEVGLTAAWIEGARQTGISEEELTQEERRELQKQISNQYSYLMGFATAIMAGSKSNKGKFAPLMSRAQMWINQYANIVNLAISMAKNDPKLRWDLGATEKHCSSCLKLDKKVKRSSYWKSHNIRPQNYPNRLLECKGGRCDCKFSVTDEALSKGPLPGLP